MTGAHALHRDTPAFVVARKEPGVNSRPLTAIASFRVLEARFASRGSTRPRGVVANIFADANPRIRYSLAG